MMNDLQYLITLFEENEKDLSDVPKEYIDKYGFSCLANCLMFKEPKIPEFNKDPITDYIKTHNFSTFDDIVIYVNSLTNDIDKLYAIYAWTAINIKYDVEKYFSKDHKSVTYEDVFLTKKAVCSGYTKIFIEIANRCNLNKERIRIDKYSNLSKGYSFNSLNPPKTPKHNHASVFIEIDGYKFLCEPTWGSGYVDSFHQYHENFKPELFLIPIYKTLNDHFPMEESTDLIPIQYSYQEFLNSCQINDYIYDIKTETNPFSTIKCDDGYLELIYNCIGPIENVNFSVNLLKEDSTFLNLQRKGIINYEIIQKNIPNHPNRCRFKVYIALPEKGIFQVHMHINHIHVLSFNIDNLEKSSKSIPLFPYKYSKFIPVFPKTTFTKVNTNYSLIRFAVPLEKTYFLWNLKKVKNETFDVDYNIENKKGSFVTLQIPFDDNFYENQLLVNFPSKGRFVVEIFLKNDNNVGYSFVSEYFFDVSYNNEFIDTKEKNIFDFIYNGRTFLSQKFVDDKDREMIVQPNYLYNIVTDEKITVDIKTEPNENKLYLYLMKENEKIDNKKFIPNNNQVNSFQFSLSKGFGLYKLIGRFSNCSKSINIQYYYTNKLLDQTKEEIEILDELKNKIERMNNEEKDEECIKSKELKKENVEIKKIEDISKDESKEEKIDKEKDDLELKIESKEEKIDKEKDDLVLKIESKEEKIDKEKDDLVLKVESKETKRKKNLALYKEVDDFIGPEVKKTDQNKEEIHELAEVEPPKIKRRINIKKFKPTITYITNERDDLVDTLIDKNEENKRPKLIKLDKEKVVDSKESSIKNDDKRDNQHNEIHRLPPINTKNKHMPQLKTPKPNKTRVVNEPKKSILVPEIPTRRSFGSRSKKVVIDDL